MERPWVTIGGGRGLVTGGIGEMGVDADTDLENGPLRDGTTGAGELRPRTSEESSSPSPFSDCKNR